MLKNVIKSILLQNIEMTGAYNYAIRHKKGASVLCYHGVEKKIDDKRIQYLQLPFSLFEKQIKYIKNNFEFISIDYLYECLENGYKLDSRQVVITFDDGYKNTLYIAAPLLNAYNIPFTVFISTNHIDKGLRFPLYFLHTSIYYTDQEMVNIKSIKKKYDISTRKKRQHANASLLNTIKSVSMKKAELIIKELIDLLPNDKWNELNKKFTSELPLNWKEVVKLNSLGATIGSHCHDHTILHNNQSDSEIDYQVRKSRELILSHLGTCKYFAYPNGGINDICSKAYNSVPENGYLLGFTTILGVVKADSIYHILPRIGGEKDLDMLKLDLNTIWRYKKLYANWCVNFFN